MPKAKQEHGNVLFIILMAIFLLALLTRFISQGADQQADGMSRETRLLDINRLMSHASNIAATVGQMINNEVDPATISGVKPGDAGYGTAPHQAKIYHALGGGVQYIGSIGSATNIRIATQQTVTGIGASNALTTGAEILLVAQVSSAMCADINSKILGSTTVPTMADANFSVFIADSAAQVIAAGQCASCVNVPALCVSNVSVNNWAYYSTLYAR